MIAPPDTEPDSNFQRRIADLYATESRRVYATLVKLLGDFDLAEEALQEGFNTALQKWPTSGVPANPTAWLVSVGRFRVIDNLRRQRRFCSLESLGSEFEEIADPAPQWDEAEQIEDDRLRLIFTCCHPALPLEGRLGLTLREVCGLTTEEIARAFLVPTPTIAQRIVRAKAKIRADKIPYLIPEGDQLGPRLGSVLRVIYLVFNEGHSSSIGELVMRRDLSDEAIRLARLLAELLPEAEVLGLLALMLLHDSRRLARLSPEGDLVLLEQQDRDLWDRGKIAEGTNLLRKALALPRSGSYSIQAAIAAVHAEGTSAVDTDWGQIVGLYDALLDREPSSVIALNRAVALTMRDGPLAGLEVVDRLMHDPSLQSYHLAHATQADILRRLGRTDEARVSYAHALNFARQAPERRFLEKRISDLKA